MKRLQNRKRKHFEEQVQIVEDKMEIMVIKGYQSNIVAKDFTNNDLSIHLCDISAGSTPYYKSTPHILVIKNKTVCVQLSEKTIIRDYTNRYESKSWHIGIDTLCFGIKDSIWTIFLQVWEKVKIENLLRREKLLSKKIIPDVAKYICEFIPVLNLEEELKMIDSLLDLSEFHRFPDSTGNSDIHSQKALEFISHFCLTYDYMLPPIANEWRWVLEEYSRSNIKRDYSRIL